MKKRLLLFAALFMVMAVPQSVLAYDFSYTYQGTTLYYTITDNSQHQVAVVNPLEDNYHSYVTGDVVIPDSVEYNSTMYAVTSIGNFAFYDCDGLTSVTIGGSVTSIGDNAFRWCRGLTSLIIPNSVNSIGNYALCGCSALVSLTISNSVTSIGDDAFLGIRHIEYNGNATGAMWGAYSMNGVVDGDYIFSNSDKDTLLAYIGVGGDVTIPNSVTIIGNGAFYCCSGLTSVTIPNSVIIIGDDAFSSCSALTSVTIGNSVTSIGLYAFFKDQNSIDTIYLMAEVPPTVAYLTFWGVSVDVVILVPCGTLEDYQAADYWGMFPNISEGDQSCYYRLINALPNDMAYGIVGGGGIYRLEDTITLSAMPYNGYAFTGWADGNTDNPRLVMVSGDTTYTANFVPAILEPVHDTTYIDVHDTTYVDVHDTTYIDVHDTTYVDVHDTTYIDVHDTTYVDVHDTTYIDVHDTTYIDVFVHDTTIVTDTVTLTEYVPVHDTTYIDVPYAVHDTTVVVDTLTLTEYVPVHDTTYIDVFVHDTTIVTDTVTLTEYVPVHDTTYIDVPYAVHDTTVVVDTLTLTEYVTVHDTTYIDVFVHDTTIVTDTVTLTEYVQVHDTTIVTVTDTVVNTVYDTVTNTVYDTVTNTLYDTVDNYIYDTTIVTDTLWLTLYDTVYITDTIVIHDTVYVPQDGIDDVATANIRLYQRNGSIVVEDADGGMLPEVRVYDAVGRLMSGKMNTESGKVEMPVPASGVYLVKIGERPARRVVVIR